MTTAEILEAAAKITEQMRATHPALADRRDVPQVPHLLRELAEMSTENTPSVASYTFSFGPSPSYRSRESLQYATLAEARAAAYDKRCMGWSTSRIRKETR